MRDDAVVVIGGGSEWTNRLYGDGRYRIHLTVELVNCQAHQGDDDDDNDDRRARVVGRSLVNA